MKEELIKLLKTSEDIPKELLKLIVSESEEAKYRSVLGISENISSLYKLRYRAKKEREAPIPNGLEALIARLENITLTQIRIQSLSLKNYVFISFTDEQSKVFLGVIWGNISENNSDL